MKSYLVLGDCKFEVDARYSIIDVIGQGAYGVVWYAPITLCIPCILAAHALVQRCKG
jgi:hypothetical protein